MAFTSPKDRLGSTIADKYRLDAILGKGGMGVVFAGLHTWTDRKVAIKVLLPQFTAREEIVRRFLNEAKAASKIHDPHVIEVLDMGRAKDEVYLVMEFLEGESLKDRLKRGCLTVSTAVELLTPIMRALQKAHDKHIVHRDLKPDNIHLAELHGKLVPKLLDFGIAKVRSDNQEAGTATGSVMGTAWYMSPEQARGEKGLGAPSDVWSMGVVFYVAVSGRRPYIASNPMMAIVCLGGSGKMTPLKEAAPEAPNSICDIIDRCLVRDPAARPTMGELADSLEAAVAELRPGELTPFPLVRESKEGLLPEHRGGGGTLDLAENHTEEGGAPTIPTQSTDPVPPPVAPIASEDRGSSSVAALESSGGPVEERSEQGVVPHTGNMTTTTPVSWVEEAGRSSPPRNKAMRGWTWAAVALLLATVSAGLVTYALGDSEEDGAESAGVAASSDGSVVEGEPAVEMTPEAPPTAFGAAAAGESTGASSEGEGQADAVHGEESSEEGSEESSAQAPTQPPVGEESSEDDRRSASERRRRRAEERAHREREEASQPSGSVASSAGQRATGVSPTHGSQSGGHANDSVILPGM